MTLADRVAYPPILMKKPKAPEPKETLDERVQIRLSAEARGRVMKFQIKFKEKTRAEIGFGEAIRILVDAALDKEGIR